MAAQSNQPNPSQAASAQVNTQMFYNGGSSIDGIGSFASVRIPRGHLIHSERPFLYQCSDDYPVAPQDPQDPQWQTWLGLRPPGTPLPEIFRTTSISCGAMRRGNQQVELWGVFLQAVRFNSSCQPNVHAHWNERESCIEFRALQDVGVNEELCFCYNPPTLLYSTVERRQMLFTKFGFYCNCTTCIHNLPGSDQLRTDLRRRIEAGVPKTSSSAQAVSTNHSVGNDQADREKLLDSIRQKTSAIVDLGRAGLYHYADTLHFDLYMAQNQAGNTNHAMLYLLKARNLSCAMVGKEDPRVRHMTGMLPTNLRDDFAFWTRTELLPATEGNVSLMAGPSYKDVNGPDIKSKPDAEMKGRTNVTQQPLPQVPAASTNSHRRAATSTANGTSTYQFPNAARGYRTQKSNSSPPMNANAGRGQAAPRNGNRRTSTEDPLLQLVKYDTVIIVGDSSSMTGRLWLETEQALVGVASLAAKYDSDGIDIYFLNSPETGKGVTAEDVQRLFARIDPDGITPIGEKLEILLLDYLLRLEQAKAEQDAGNPQAMQQIRPVNFLVITDGAPTDDPETVIVTAARRLDQGKFPISQIGIQFVQVGSDPYATEAFRELDDDLAGKYGIRDIVDTIPYSGHQLDAQTLTKILLGGINRRVTTSTKEGAESDLNPHRRSATEHRHGDITPQIASHDAEEKLLPRSVGGLGQFRAVPIKPLVPCLTVAYILAQRILSLARSSRIFPMQKVHIARQTMHVLILFNDSLDVGTGLCDKQEEERISLEDELRDFEKFLKRSDNLVNVKHDGALMLHKFHKQFFRLRPYVESARNVETDVIFPKLEAYDLRTLEMMQFQTA